MVKLPKGLINIESTEVPSYYEIAVPLFERCNLNCSFCFESHSNLEIDCDYILSIPHKIIEQVKKDLEDSDLTIIKLRLWGGELFFDALDDSIFVMYRKFINTFHELVQKHLPGKKVHIEYLSNGVFTKYKRVDSLLKDTNGTIAFSYDPVNRFSCDQQKEIWLKTVNYFKDKTRCISITLTKQSIAAYIAGDPYFEKIPKNISVDINYYMANENWEEHILSDDDIFNFYKWCVDNKKYNIHTLDTIFRYFVEGEKEHIERHCNCNGKYSVQFTNGVCEKDCAKRSSSLNRELFYGKYTDETTPDNVSAIKTSLGISKRGCLYCEHYDHCTMFCWISIIFSGFKATNCPLRRIYNYITHEQVEDFKKWRTFNGKN